MTVAQQLHTGHPSRLASAWKSISIVFESRVATVGLVMVLFWVLVAFVSLFWTPYAPNATDFKQNLPPMPNTGWAPITWVAISSPV